MTIKDKADKTARDIYDKLKDHYNKMGIIVPTLLHNMIHKQVTQAIRNDRRGRK